MGIVCGECSYASEGVIWSIIGVYTVYSLYSTRNMVGKHPKRLFWPFWPLVTPRAPRVTSAGLSLRVGITIDVLSTSKSVGNRLLAVLDQYISLKTHKKAFLAIWSAGKVFLVNQKTISGSRKASNLGLRLILFFWFKNKIALSVSRREEFVSCF